MFLLIHSPAFRMANGHLSLHSTMFLLIQSFELRKNDRGYTLHSTMFLLILISQWVCSSSVVFTFHYVSINTKERNLVEYLDIKTLHSTMFLLILNRRVIHIVIHITLHSTMFLLILPPPFCCSSRISLYIPLCFY